MAANVKQLALDIQNNLEQAAKALTNFNNATIALYMHDCTGKCTDMQCEGRVFAKKVFDDSLQQLRFACESVSHAAEDMAAKDVMSKPFSGDILSR